MKYRNLKIAISSGKGGTGKTFVATNIAFVLKNKYKDISYLDCDVEEPNGHLFIKPDFKDIEDINLISPGMVDTDKCTLCGKCEEVCTYNAIVIIRDKVLLFKELCHVCGACSVVCPEDAVIEEERKIGVLRKGNGKGINCYDALLETGEGGMSPRLIKKVKDNIGGDINILDSPPGTACPVVETVRDVDLCVLVTDPTPFGVHDLKLSVDMVREIGHEPVIVVNRANYKDNKLKIYCKEEKLKIIGEIPDKREIAEIYSDGHIVSEKDGEIRNLFEQLAEKIIRRAGEKIPVLKKTSKTGLFNEIDVEKAKAYKPGKEKLTFAKELVVISGKGGTGKTSITACFAFLSRNSVICDCDVDAADLHLILNPEIKEKGYFSGGVEAKINLEKCTGCGECIQECRFLAINEKDTDEGIKYEIDPVVCEGCGVCGIVCAFDAVDIKDAVNGEWYVSDSRYGPFSHARLGIAEENSGRLVTLVKDKSKILAEKIKATKTLIDGAPGTGCPVISSLNGAYYTVIVTEPTVSGIHDMKRILDVTAHFGTDTGVIINKYDLNKKNTEKIEKLCKDKGVELLGTIPYDTVITDAQMMGLPVVEYAPESEVSKNISRIYKKIERRFNSQI